MKKLLLPILLMLALLAVACAKAPAEEAPPAEVVAPPAAEVAPPAEEVAAPVERTLRVSFAWPLYIDPAVGSD